MRDLDDITGAIIAPYSPSHGAGLLINFGAPTVREGLRRIVNGLQPSASPREPNAVRRSRGRRSLTVGFPTNA